MITKHKFMIFAGILTLAMILLLYTGYSRKSVPSESGISNIERCCGAGMSK